MKYSDSCLKALWRIHELAASDSQELPFSFSPQRFPFYCRMKLLKLWKWYQDCLAVHPVKTQVISSGLIWGFGDICAQTITHTTAKRHLQIGVSITTFYPPNLEFSFVFSCFQLGLAFFLHCLGEDWFRRISFCFSWILYSWVFVGANECLWIFFIGLCVLSPGKPCGVDCLET